VTELPLSGGCLCGAVRFELNAVPLDAGYCHCTRCQRRTGTSSSAQARVEAAALAIVAGEELVACWRHPDGGAEKCFCRACGAHVFSRYPEPSPHASIRMSAFDGDPGVRPSFRQWVAYGATWEPIPDDGLERFDESAPRPNYRGRASA